MDHLQEWEFLDYHKDLHGHEKRSSHQELKKPSGDIPITPKLKEVPDPQSDHEEAEDQGPVSQVFSKKEHQSVDTKLDSPESKGNSPDKGSEEVAWEGSGNSEDRSGRGLWKWSLTRIGAICLFGIAAATTICIVIIGVNQKNKQQKQNQQQLRLQIYTDDDKRMKQVIQHATKMNETISAVKGAPTSRAHMSYGDYYNGP